MNPASSQPLAATTPCLSPGTSANDIARTIKALADLLPDSVLLADVSASELGVPRYAERLVEKFNNILAISLRNGVCVVMPVIRNGLWTVAIAELGDGRAAVSMYDTAQDHGRLKKDTARASALIMTLINGAANPTLTGAHIQILFSPSAWSDHPPCSPQKGSGYDSGLGILAHIFQHVSGFSLPKTTDWWLCRRLVAAFLDGLCDPDSAKGEEQSGPVLKDLRSFHRRTFHAAHAPTTLPATADVSSLLSQLGTASGTPRQVDLPSARSMLHQLNLFGEKLKLALVASEAACAESRSVTKVSLLRLADVVFSLQTRT